MMDTVCLLDRNAVTQRCPNEETMSARQRIDDEREHVTMSGIGFNQPFKPPAYPAPVDEVAVRAKVGLRNSEFLQPFEQIMVSNHGVPLRVVCDFVSAGNEDLHSSREESRKTFAEFGIAQAWGINGENGRAPQGFRVMPTPARGPTERNRASRGIEGAKM
jgi:hypothetical protein